MHDPSIHTTLARSYLAYFVCSIVGLWADTYIGLELVPTPYTNTIAILCFAVGALLIVWAQYTSRTRSTTSTAVPYFFHGPYRYMRNPTHLGIVILVTGYTAVSGSLVFCAVTVVGYMISNKFFRRYEAILGQTYDGAYEEYKSKVPKIF